MKKAICFLASVLIIVCVCSVYVFAENEEYELENFPKEVSDELFSTMSDEVREALEAIGINDLDFKSVYNFSFGSVLSYFTPQLKEKGSRVLSGFFELLVCVMLLSVFGVILEDGKNKKLFSLFSSALIAVIILPSVQNVLSSGISVLKISNTFIVSYVPVLTLILSFSGNAASAMLFNSFLLGMCEVMSAVINNVVVQFMGCFICLSVTYSLDENLRVQRLISAVNKGVTLILTSAASLFSGILTVKNVMAVSLDSLSVRGVRFLLSSFIPIIGSSISEAYSSVLGSINLIKGSVSVIGIIAIAVINLPVIAETFMYYLSFSALAYISEISSCNQVSDVLRAIASVMRILIVLIVFEMFVLVISTGIILTIKNA